MLSRVRSGDKHAHVRGPESALREHVGRQDDPRLGVGHPSGLQVHRGPGMCLKTLMTHL